MLCFHYRTNAERQPPRKPLKLGGLGVLAVKNEKCMVEKLCFGVCWGKGLSPRNDGWL
jgi:hypothetical protein